MTDKPKKPRGRPKGSKNIKEVSTVPATSCMKCQSTDRSNYESNPRRVRGYFVDAAGEQYDIATLRLTKCLNCGQRRVDRELSRSKKFVEYLAGEPK